MEFARDFGSIIKSSSATLENWPGTNPINNFTTITGSVVEHTRPGLLKQTGFYFAFQD
jgi:hypothetical protein